MKHLFTALFLSVFIPAVSFGASPNQLAAVNAAMDLIEVGELRAMSSAETSVEPVKTPRIENASSKDQDLEKLKISGEVRMSMGIDSNGGFEWNRADGNLNERNWRLLTKDNLNNYENTYDPAIYQRLKVVVDAAITDAISMHMNVTADPWSYTGKTKKQTITGTLWNDAYEVEYLTWGASGYTIGQSINSLLLGNTTNLSEVKVQGGKVPATTLVGGWDDGYGGHDAIPVPETKIDYTFNPLRELWVDLKPGDLGTIRVFPMAYEDQALTSDDPLGVSNHRKYWEESPWVRSWQPGNYNPDAGTPSFTVGKWDRALVNLSRDSDGTWLTALRGVALDLQPNDGGSLKAVVATPKTLWQDYNEVSAIPGSLRWKQYFAERLFVGVTGAMHLGLVDSNKIDAENYVESVDIGAMPLDGVELSAQVSASQSDYEQTNATYRRSFEGHAYYASLEMSTNSDEMLQKDYFGLIAPKGEQTFAKTRLYFGMMDDTYESSLSDFRATRSDSFWSRHISFYPGTYRNMPGTKVGSTEWDYVAAAVGDGMDYGRQVVGWRGDSEFFEGALKAMADTRYVTDTNEDFIESVSRTQVTYQATDKLETKALFLHHAVPPTAHERDPYISSGRTGSSLINEDVTSGKNADLNTLTLGARYQAMDRMALNAVWERTNDFTLGADNFPNGILNEAVNSNYTQNGLVYNDASPYLYSQSYFDQAPYAYHNIWKTGIELKPTDIWTIYADYAFNPNKFWGNIDDNYNHFGIETSIVPNDKFGLFARYTFARWYKLDRLVSQDILDQHDYNNFYVETRYCRNKDSKLSLMYGVGPSYNIGIQGVNPTLPYYNAPVMDTQHIIRLIYEQKF